MAEQEKVKVSAKISDTESASSLSYEALMTFHGCENLQKCAPDDKGDTACWALLISGRTLPCRMKDIEALAKCMDYCGPLIEKVRIKRLETDNENQNKS